MKLSNLFNSFFLALIAAMLPQLASADDFMVDGLCYYYNSDGTSVSVTSGDNYTGDIIIPENITYNGTTYSVTSIGNYAFFGCSGLTSVTIPYSVTSIGNHAFRGCCGLTSITIPNSVTSIGGVAFLGCSGLTSMVVEGGNMKYDSRNNCNAIIETATNTLIFGCKNTIIPNSVTEIGYGAFYRCTGLTEVTIPSSVTTIGEKAFYCCTGLTSVTIGNSVTEIGGSAFLGCSGLTEVTIPNSVTSIGNYAFRNCSGLTSVTIGSSVTSIGGSAFRGCSGLKSIYSKIQNPGSVSYGGSDIFQGVITTHCKLYVPTGKVEDYQFTAPWSDFLNILEEGGGGGSTPVYGDVNGDGHVNSVDVTIIYNILLGNDKGETHNE
ncbi:MAG: leucine-rich repeat protein [Muribaculaceae bacterium]|nr:leucine-rich repeat protein [Muribaculaceae bacterium]MBQ6649596.1 leucine-rich repeat protein [Muribaculaceae bacterium]